MLSKKNRANKKDIDLLFKQGKSIVSANFNFKFIFTGSSLPPRISFITPKSAAKAAVKRNLLRRRGYKALEKYINDFPVGLIGAFVFKKYQDDISIIENEIKNVPDKIN